MRRLVRDGLIPLLKPFYKLLQMLIPPVQNRVLYFSKQDYSDNAYYQYRHLLLNRESLEHVWVLLDSTLAVRIRREYETLTAARGMRGHRLRIVRAGTVTAHFLLLTSRYIFHTHGLPGLVDCSARRTVICLWHGMPIKAIGYLNHISPRRYPAYGDIHVATSHFFKYVLASAFRVPPEKVLVSGLPRCDALESDAARDSSAADVRKALDIPTGNRLLLWMPTYRSEPMRVVPGARFRSFLDDLPEWLIPALTSACKARGYSVVIKLHWMDPLNQVSPPDLGPAVRFVTASDWQRQAVQLYDLIAASDGLISDVSSVLIDYLATRRPCAIAGFNPKTYSRELLFPIDWLLGCDTCFQLEAPEDLGIFMDALSQGAPKKSANISQVLYQPSPGSAAESIAVAAGL